jgi:cell division topological specificity factor
MSFLSKFLQSRRKTSSAATAKERLQIIISHEHVKAAHDYLPMLQRDLVKVISKYVEIDEEQISVALNEEDNCKVLELNITMPNAAEAKQAETA